ncbi:transcription termination factor NusA [Mesoplasma lactucae]|uniref:Transcription termination/antitermination protein NusA n=1 Tax=Mesoplasma lactucae ATCC 49193 TaxID=81460 RepID=A0A291IRU1_9MOLU|nr:transcription termination factor NusA [Mesoplasma lactucae]ATG97458.1 transcription termination/antitermination protein NusA [Mesoplasma lactucae ATCC 49193]ATZ20087.1 transcription elongation factor NusA [Mesoplasma lactucae ATCC 49193]MCL8216835.1 hypothetical protein [Mesoplasma lactucae ATCC 49193]
MKNTAEILEALTQIATEKEIDKEEVIEGIKEGFKKAYERFFDPEAVTEVDFDEQTGAIKMFLLLKVVQKVDDDWLEIGINEAKDEFGDNVAIGDVVKRPVEFEDEFSRLAVHQVRQIVQQKIRSSERERIYNKFIDKAHELLTGKVVGMNDQGTAYLVDVDGVNASLWNKKLIPDDEFEVGDFVTFYVEDVEKDNRFSQIQASRTAPGFLKKIIEREIPEVADGTIEIMGVSRQPGVRAKVAAISHDENIEPIGSIVGPQGSRITNISNQLNGEKIDVVEWNEDINKFIMNAMAPVRVVSVDVDEENNEADIIVPDEQLSLAIGRNGIAARIVANLLKMKINILSVSQAQELGIPVQWNGNITEEELTSKDFLDATNRRKNKTNQPSKPNFKNNKTSQRANYDPIADLEQELERFQAELAKENETHEQKQEQKFAQEQVNHEEEKIEEDIKEVETNLDEIQENLKAFEEITSDDEEDEDEDFDDEDFDSYYDEK